MTYNVFDGTLSLTQSINQSLCSIQANITPSTLFTTWDATLMDVTWYVRVINFYTTPQAMINQVFCL